MSNITLTIPNDDHIALRAFGKALEEMALAHGAEPVQMQTYCNVTMNDELNDQLRQKLKNVLGEPRNGDIDVTRVMVEQCAPIIDTTAQQVESLATIKPFEERLELLDKALSKETPESLAEKLQSYNPEPTTDSTGTPWDERIHSTSKALNADGTWRLRRKPKDMDELEWSDYVSMIKADLQYPVECGGEDEEIDQEHYAAETSEGVNDIEPPVTPPGDDFHTDVGVVTEQTVAGIPPLPVPPPVALPGSTGATDLLPPAPIPTAVPTPVDWTFPKLMTFLTERQGKIDVPTVNMLLAQDGIASLPELNAQPDKIGPFVARVKAHLGE